MLGGEGAFVSLSEKITFRGLIGHFKFIHLLILPLIYFLYSLIKAKKNNLDENVISLLLVIVSVYLFIFNQLLTANQTFIFSLIPIVGGFFYVHGYSNKMIKQKNISPGIALQDLTMGHYINGKLHKAIASSPKKQSFLINQQAQEIAQNMQIICK